MSLLKTFFVLSLLLFILYEDALAINIQLDKKEIEEAIKHGKQFGKDIFKSHFLKHACISFWPGERRVVGSHLKHKV